MYLTLHLQGLCTHKDSLLANFILNITSTFFSLFIGFLDDMEVMVSTWMVKKGKDNLPSSVIEFQVFQQ